MPRQDVPYGGAICRLKERIAEIWDKLDQKLHSINGVEGDGAGNVEIASGNAAVVINNDQIGHRIEVSLDSSKLPAAAVSSVNGQTGEVRLDAADIPSNGNSNVQSDIDWYKQRINECFNSIATEQDDRQVADATLQTNINASNGRISVLETEDTGNMKLNRNQTATGDNTFTGRLKAEGQPTYSPSQPTDDVATIGTLNAYNPMVRTTGNQSITGKKTFSILSNSHFDSDITKVISGISTQGIYRQLFFVPISSLANDNDSLEVIVSLHRAGSLGFLHFIVGVRKNEAENPLFGWKEWINPRSSSPTDILTVTMDDENVYVWVKAGNCFQYEYGVARVKARYVNSIMNNTAIWTPAVSNEDVKTLPPYNHIIEV